MMRYLEKKAKDAGKLSKPMEIIINCCSLCLLIFERIIKFINKNAYIQCAITSHNFCVSAKDAFFLITRNSFLFAIAAGIGEAFILIGELFISITTTVGAYYAVKAYYSNNELNSVYGVIIVILPTLSLIFLDNFHRCLSYWKYVHVCMGYGS